jgi:hypothetical protein
MRVEDVLNHRVAALYRRSTHAFGQKMPTIPEFLRARFPDPQFSNHYIDLFGEYLDSGLAPPNVEAEIMTGDRGSMLTSGRRCFIGIFGYSALDSIRAT